MESPTYSIFKEQVLTCYINTNIWRVKYYQPYKMGKCGIFDAATGSFPGGTSVLLFDYGDWRLS
ncbi:hypothetical protein P4H39_13365 [Paenibacillus lautus]|uniref:hypothetical protein n=1 Tax=Paenibacillus lautus TaxID=1401 RepID=UPI002DBC6507|nr:hypothetical protein [Paenibacillus lautus]MEC0203626.1 hypothetical protein [Paenibacillus lautus]